MCNSKVPLCILQAEINFVGQNIRVASTNINDAICAFEEYDRHHHKEVAIMAIVSSIDQLQTALDDFRKED